jgi:hypothetical protein
MSREAMKQALETLEQINQLSIGENAIALPGEIDAAMDSLRAALDAPEPDYERGFVDGMQEQMKRSVDRAVNAMCKREWIGLTEIEICDIEVAELPSASSETFSFARAIEAKLKEKNT